jgi:TolB protein
MVRRILVAMMTLLGIHRLAAQNPIVLGVSGSSRAQPGLVVLAGRGLDSVRMIVQRDLQNSDRFTVSTLFDSAGTLPAPLDSSGLKGITGPGLNWVVELQRSGSGVSVTLWDAATSTVRQRGTPAVDLSGLGDTRITIHRVSDQVVTWTGGIGIAATRIAFKMKNGSEDAIWRVDADGVNLARVSRSGFVATTPAWHPDGSAIAYSEFRGIEDGRWHLYVQRLASGTRTEVTSMAAGNAYGGTFSPDGKTMLFTYLGPSGGAAIESVDVARNCCAFELTHDRRNADNQSATYQPNGRHIAYISTRLGTPQIFVMDADGSNPEAYVPQDFNDHGRLLDTYSPAWSPDGTKLSFSRDLSGGGRQVFQWSIGSGQPVRVTNTGRNEDPSWAPDSRHVIFKSGRSGREQLWILDIESGAQRQIGTPGDARSPAWSPVLGTNP